jgi:hypothetical protein
MKNSSNSSKLRTFTTSGISQSQHDNSEILNLTYTPYVKFFKDVKNDKYYFAVMFLSKEGVILVGTNEEISKKGKIIITITLDTTNCDDTKKDTISQLTFDTAKVLGIEEAIKKGINFNYEVNILHGNKSNDKGKLIIEDKGNPVGGTTNPADPYPPAKKK